MAFVQPIIFSYTRYSNWIFFLSSFVYILLINKIGFFHNHIFDFTCRLNSNMCESNLFNEKSLNYISRSNTLPQKVYSRKKNFKYQRFTTHVLYNIIQVSKKNMIIIYAYKKTNHYINNDKMLDVNVFIC